MSSPSGVLTHFGLQDPRFQSLVYPMIVPTTINTAGNVAYTPAQVMSGWINRDCNGAARTDALPSAASLVAAIQGCMVNSAFEFEVQNISAGAFAVTINPGAGGTMVRSPSQVADLFTRTYLIIFTNVTPGSEAYSVYPRATAAY